MTRLDCPREDAGKGSAALLNAAAERGAGAERTALVIVHLSASGLIGAIRNALFRLCHSFRSRHIAGGLSAVQHAASSQSLHESRTPSAVTVTGCSARAARKRDQQTRQYQNRGCECPARHAYPSSIPSFKRPQILSDHHKVVNRDGSIASYGCLAAFLGRLSKVLDVPLTCAYAAAHIREE
jgi:hypothetical protein